MRYALAVLTHGDNETILADTIASFEAHVSTPPVSRLIVQDGPCALPPVAPYPWTCLTLSEPRGFCGATRALWGLALEQEDVEFVFWLEHDFIFGRSFNVDEMARILAEDESFAQVSLMRNPVNRSEEEAGGVVEDLSSRGYIFHRENGYLKHSAYFTTNPSLMTWSFMRKNPWPAYSERCEGRYALDLIAKGYHFAIMGSGEPWIEHVGQRTGHSY